MRSLRSVWVVLVLGASASAQVVASATASQPLVASSSVSGSVQFAVGPLPIDGLSLWTPGNSGTNAIVYVDTLSSSQLVGATGWSLYINLNASTSWSPNWAAATGQLLVQFQSPQPVDGVLFFEPYWSEWWGLSSITGDATVDIDSDGLPDFSARTPPSTGTSVELPCTIGTTPLSVTLNWNVTGSLLAMGQPLSGSMRFGWKVSFVPGTYALEPYGAGCTNLWVDRSWWGASPMSPHLVCGPGSGSDMVVGGFLLGFGQQNTSLSLPPQCPLLVANPTLVPPTLIGPHGMFLDLPHFQLPLGVQFLCQGIWLDAAGLVISSNAVRSR